MRRRLLVLLATLGGCVLLGGCGAADPGSANAASLDPGSANTEPSPMLENSTVWTFDGDAREMHEFIGRPLVLNFFAESCPPCVREMPAFDSVAREVAGEIEFLGVSEDATAAAGRRIVKATGIGYATVWDADGSALRTLESMGLPTTAFVAGSGEVLEVHTGELSADELRERLTVHFGI